MADLYIGPDGVIHSRRAGGVQEAVSVHTTGGAVRPNTGNRAAVPRQPARSKRRDVSAGRKAFYWIFTLTAGLLIGAVGYRSIGAWIFAACEEAGVLNRVLNWLCSLAPYVFLIGGGGGSFLYGICEAEDRYYDLGAVVLAEFWAVGGVLALAFLLACLCLLIAMMMYLMGLVLAIVIVGTIVGAFCSF